MVFLKNRPLFVAFFWMIFTVAASDPSLGAPSTTNLLLNGGFEDFAGESPSYWSLGAQNRGVVRTNASMRAGGRASLEILPNKNNVPGPEKPGVVQTVPIPRDFLGLNLKLSGYLAAKGGAKAVILIAGLAQDGSEVSKVVWRSKGVRWARQEGVLECPPDGSVRTVVVICVAEGNRGSAYVDEIALEPAAVSASAAPAGDSKKSAFPAQIRVNASQVLRTIPETLFGANVEWSYGGNGVWNEQENRLNRDLLDAAREAGVSLIRFPGGGTSDYYHWADKVGPSSSRTPVPTILGGPALQPSFATNEYLEFLQALGGQSLITVNAGTGTPEEAADWIRYVRTHSQVPSVYWEVGNELYMKGDQESSMAVAVPPDVYAQRFVEFAGKMREAAPDIKIGAIGGEEFGNFRFISYADWNPVLLAKAGKEMDFLAVHNAYAPVLVEPDPDPVKVYKALLAAPLLIRKNLDLLDRQIEQFAGDTVGRIRLAVTEWGPIYQVGTSQPYYDHVKTLGSALFVASTMKAFAESERTDIATFFLLCDYVNMGWIGRRDGVFIAKAPLYAFRLFARHFGRVVVRTQTESPVYDSPAVGYLPAVKGVPYLESVASLSADGKSLYLIVINKHFSDDIEAQIRIEGFVPAAESEIWTLTGAGIDANTGTQLFEGAGIKWGKQKPVPPFNRIDRGGPGEIRFESRKISSAGPDFGHVFPRHSVTSLKFVRQSQVLDPPVKSGTIVRDSGI